MNLFQTILDNWSQYELLMIGLTTFLLLIIQVVFNIIYNMDKRLVLIAAISSLSVLVVSSLSLFISNTFFNIDLTEKYSFVIVWSSTINMLNLCTLNNFFRKKRKSKNFDEDIVNREHFSDTLKLVAFLFLFFSVLIAFTTNELQNILILSGISSVLSLSLNHLLARKFFKDKKGEK